MAKNDFEKRVIETATDLLALGSFLSRERILWYEYVALDKGFLRTEIRRVRHRTSGKVDIHDLVVPPEKIRAFLRIAHRRIVQHRLKGIDLIFPMLLYVSSFEFDTSAERLIAAFRALENLLSILAPGKTLLPRKKFANVRNILSSHISSGISDPLATAIIEKLPELNRPAFRRTLEDMCRKLKVSAGDDLYPSGQRPTFIRTRDDLVHGQLIEDMTLLYKETERIRAVFERLMLKTLGWSDVSRAPRVYNRSFLTGQ